MKLRLDDLTLFLTVAEHGSFRRAAVALNLSPSALSHAMRALETRLGMRLLDRTTRRMAFTDAGARLAARLRPALTDVEAAIAELREEAPQLTGRIRITTMDYGVMLLFECGLAEFQRRHPEVAIELTVDAALTDLVSGGFDAGIRFRDDVPSDMTVLPIAPPALFVAVASPEYLAGRSVPSRPPDLLEHRCIRQRLANGTIYRWEFEVARRRTAIDPPGTLTVNNLTGIITAALHGAGVCYVPKHHVIEMLASGRLVLLLQEFSPQFDGHCLYYRASRQPTRAFKAFVEHLRRRDPPYDWVSEGVRPAGD